MSTDATNSLKTSVSEGKSLVAAAVTGKGVNTAANATFQTIANNIGSIGTAMSIVDLYRNAEFHASAQYKYGNGIYFIYPKNKVPSSLYYFFTSYQTFNSYQSLIYNISAIIPNPGYNTSMNVEFTRQANALHFNRWDANDGTKGSMARGTITTESAEMNFSYDTSNTNFVIGSAQMTNFYGGISEYGSITGTSAIIIPYY